MTPQRDEDDLVNDQSSTIHRRAEEGWFIVSGDEELAGPFTGRGRAMEWLRVTLAGWTGDGEHAYAHPRLGTVQLDAHSGWWQVRTPTGREISKTRSPLQGIVYLQGLNAFTRLVHKFGVNACNLGMASIVVAPAVGGLQPDQCPHFALLIFLLCVVVSNPSEKRDNPIAWAFASAIALAASLITLSVSNVLFADAVAGPIDLETGRALAIGGAIAFVLGRLLARAGNEFRAKGAATPERAATKRQ